MSSVAATANPSSDKSPAKEAVTLCGEEGKAPKVSVQSTPEAITVYQNQVLVRRDAKIALPRAYDEVLIEFPLPNGSIDEDSVQVRFSESLSRVAVLRGVRIEEVRLPVDVEEGVAASTPDEGNQEEEEEGVSLRVLLKNLDDELEKNNMRLTAAQKKLSYVETLSKSAVDDKLSPLNNTDAMWDVNVWRAQLDTYEAALEEFSRSKKELTEERQRLSKRRELLKSFERYTADSSSDEEEEEEAVKETRLDDGQASGGGGSGGGGDPKVVSEVAEPTANTRPQRMALIALKTTAPLPESAGAAIMVTYLSSQGSWAPRYDAHLCAEAGEVQLYYNAWVTFTAEMEPLTEVDVTFSTAAPRSHGEVPQLQPWRCSVQAEATKGSSNHFGSIALQKCRAEFSSCAEGDVLNRDGLDIEAASAEAAGAGTAVVNFHVPSRQSFPLLSCKDGCKVPLTMLKLPVRLSHVCVPALQPVAYVQGMVVNTSEFPLLAGPVCVHNATRFVADALVPKTMCGDKFKLFFGGDESVDVQRKLVVREDVKRRAGLNPVSAKRQVKRYAYRTTITNHKPPQTFSTTGAHWNNDVTISVTERAPKSSEQNLTVTLVQPKPSIHFAKKPKRRSSMEATHQPISSREDSSLCCSPFNNNNNSDEPTATVHNFDIDDSSADEDDNNNNNNNGGAEKLSKNELLYVTTGQVRQKVKCAQGGGVVHVMFEFEVDAPADVPILGLDADGPSAPPPSQPAHPVKWMKGGR